uniref:Reprolysin n=1 Tax=Rhipicephalus zambeziensis TaxID=60191 RepID=A0A224YN70_9ACAR
MSFVALVCFLIGNIEGTEHTHTVYPMIVEERSTDVSLVLRVHSGLTLSLTKASVTGGVLRLRKYNNGTAVDELVPGSQIEETLFEDKQKMATVSLIMAPDDLRVTGMLSLTERIDPLLYETRHASGRRPHVIRKIRRPSGSKSIKLERRKDYPPIKCDSRKLPSNITVELYVVSDYRHNKRFPDKDLWIYICIFVNSLNAIFMSMTCPDVRLALVGIEKSDENQEMNYVFGLDFMNDMTTLHLFKDYVNKKAEQSDITVLLTGRDLYESMSGRGINKNISGIAYEGGICTPNFVAIAEDIPGSYSGVIDTAHELAHSMGASHDGSPPNEHINGHPGSLKCGGSSGHLMTYVDGGPLRYQLSECNKEEIRHVLRLRGEDCWKVKANETYSVKNIYPGILLSPRKYCEMLYKSTLMYGSTNSVLSAHCKMKCCYAREGRGMHSCAIHRMLDFMKCSYGRKCFQGVCRRESELEMYSRKKGS